MAINIPIITSLEDTGIKNAKAAFGDFKAAVGKAEGGMGKFKAGSKVALDAVAANAATFGLAAGAAIGTFAVNAVTAFQDLALSAGKFADATGLAVEDASRYIEAAGDIGVPIDAVEGAIGRLNKTIGADPDKVRDLGVDLVYLKDGSLDVNETFLNTIERIKGIKDPAEKARVAAQLLGKGWQSMSELIEMGADDLKRSLDSVSDAKVIDPEELRKAKEFRAALDELKGVSEDLTLEIGEYLVPALSDLAGVLKNLGGLKDLFEKIPGSSWLMDQINFVSPAATAYNILSSAVGGVVGIFTDDVPKALIQSGPFLGYVDNVRRGLEETEQAMVDLEEATAETDLAFENLKNELKLESALADAKTQLDGLKEKAVEAFKGSDAALAEYEQGLIDAKLMVLELAGSVTLSNAQKDKIRVLVDTGELEYALALIDAIGSNGHADLVAAAAAKALAAGRSLRIPGRAAGGPVEGGSTYLVGERGPELFTPGTSGSITPNHALGGGGANITVNVNGGDPNQIVRVLQQYVRQSGPVPLNTRAM